MSSGGTVGPAVLEIPEPRQVVTRGDRRQRRLERAKTGVLRFVLRRIAAMIVVLFVVISVLDILLHAAPTGPLSSLSPTVVAVPAVRKAIEHRLGLDQSLFSQWWHYLANLVTGDWGHSIFDGSSVGKAITSHAPVSFELGLLATIFSVIPGIGLGAWAALKHGAARDSAVRIGSVVALSLPIYWVSVLALIVVGQRFPSLVPSTSGFTHFTDGPMANLQVMLLPSLILALPTFALIARSTRAALVEVLSYDYVLFARGMGMSDWEILRRIGVRNAMLPTLTIIGVLLSELITGTIIIENVFQLPGMGELMVTAFVRTDYPMALGTTIVAASSVLLLNLIVDLMYFWVDPRLRPSAARERTA
jgi:peptide/nickel transport system permease protein